jgi:outer membrane protein assembly factor BamB
MWQLVFIGCCALTLVVPVLLDPVAVAQEPKPAEPALAEIGTRKAGVDWPIFLGPTQDSKSPEKGIITKWTQTRPRIVWSKPLGTSYGAPTIAKGRLFQFDRFEDKARIYSLNAETGKPLWQYEYPTDYSDYFNYNNGPRCSPVVDGNRVYAYGAEGKLTCLTADTGKLVWQVNTFKDFGVVQNFFGVGSTPVIDGDLIIVMVGGSPAWAQNLGAGQLDRVEGDGSGIVAFDKYTGKLKYKITDELASYASLKLATINGRRWCFAFCRSGLVGFEPQSGKVDFEYPWRAKILECVNASMPVVVEDEVFISETYGPGSTLLKVSPGSSEIVWKDDDRKRQKAMMTHWNTPVYHDGYLYGSSGRHTENAELRCIEWKTGKVMWSEPGLTRSSLLYADGHFVCQTEYGQIIVLKANPQKYEPVTEIELKEPVAGPAPLGPRLPGDAGAKPLLKYPCWAAPVLSHGLLYVRGDDRLVCLELVPEK